MQPSHLRSKPGLRRVACTAALVSAGLLSGCTPDHPVHIGVPEGAVILSGGSVYLGEGRTLDNALVVLDGDRIVAVAPVPRNGFTVSPSTRVLDLNGRTILPGLIDLHSHLGADGCFAGSMSESRLRRQLRANLAHGVTTVLDLGALPWLAAERARAAERQWDSPEILLAGPMLTVPGGHPTAASGSFAGMARRVVDEQQARLAVGEIADGGADVIKSVLEAGGFPGMPATPSLGFEQLRAIADEAHARDLRLVVHVSTTAEALQAAEAGADLLAHVPFRAPLPAELASYLASRPIAVISTLSSLEGFFRLVDDPAYVDSEAVRASVDPEVIEACRGPDVLAFAATNPFTVFAREQVGIGHRNAAALHAAGVPVVLGTDAGNLHVFHGPAVHRELHLLVQAGLTPAEAIDAATMQAAAALGREDLGSVRPGRRADLVVVEGNPAQRIEDLARIDLVIRAGRIYDRDDLVN